MKDCFNNKKNICVKRKKNTRIEQVFSFAAIMNDVIFSLELTSKVTPRWKQPHPQWQVTKISIF